MTNIEHPWLQRRFPEQSPEVAQLQYSIDQSRIIHSMAFRRLQGKTQVIGVNEHDFFRTRLTHSLEVAQIGKRLTNRIYWLFSQEDRWPKEAHDRSILPTNELIETACLSHDIGHPAFGHNGEKILNYFMCDHGGFEGNGQSLRILTRLGEYSNGFGYNLTRRSLLSVVKYPITHRTTNKKYAAKTDIIPKNINSWAPPKCIHDDESDILQWILEPLSTSDATTFQTTKTHSDHQSSIYKSFDCSIMEIADDIAYSIHDLEDAIAIGLLDRSTVVEDLTYELLELSKYKNQSISRRYYHELFSSGEISDLKRAITNIVKYFIDHTRVIKLGIFENPLLDLQLVLNDETEELLKRFKSYVFDNVINTAPLKTIEFKGQNILGELFQALETNPEKLLPASFAKELINTDPKRVITDFLATTTDREAGRLYERLFLPGSGSIFQPL